MCQTPIMCCVVYTTYIHGILGIWFPQNNKWILLLTSSVGEPSCRLLMIIWTWPAALVLASRDDGDNGLRKPAGAADWAGPTGTSSVSSNTTA